MSKYNKGFTHTGMMWNMIANIATTDMLPTSQDASGKIIQHSKFTKEDQAKWDADKEKYGSIGGWATELYDKIAPGWVGGKGNWSMHSTSKSFAQLLPYTMNIMRAYQGMNQLSTKVRGTKGLWDARSKMSKKWGTDKGLGKKIVSSLNKDFVASEKMLSRLNMVRVNHKMTFFDNYADGRARGLDSGNAFAYGNFLSLATGLSQMVMPDYNWIKSAAGGKAINNLTAALTSGQYKVAAKQISELARAAGNKAAFHTAGRNFMKEHLEEQLDVALQDVVKATYLAGHSPELFNVDMQAEVLSATTTLTVPLGSVSAVTTRRNVMSRVYKAFKGQVQDIIRQGQEEIDLIQKRIDQTGNTKKDKILREELIREQTLIKEQIKEAQNIVNAINASPKNVTDTQIDLLVRKNKLLNEKRELNKKDKSLYAADIEKINNELNSIDEQIQEHSVGNYENKLYNALLKSAQIIAPALGFKITHNSVDEETFRIAVEKEKQDIENRNAYRRKRIENIRKGKGTTIEKAKKIEKI